MTSGTYRFVALEPGSYSVQAELAGFRAAQAAGDLGQRGPDVHANFGLKVGGVTETIDVVGEAPVVDTASSATNNNLSQDLLFNMPIRQGNTATNLLNFTPASTTARPSAAMPTPATGC
jgi:hypothetical protein